MKRLASNLRFTSKSTFRDFGCASRWNVYSIQCGNRLVNVFQAHPRNRSFGRDVPKALSQLPNDTILSFACGCQCRMTSFA